MTKRLETLFALCEKAEITADVGCDHGYVSLNLLQTGKTKQIIAADISAPSLKKAEKLLKMHNLSQFASFRVGDGLKVVNSEEKLNQVVIAGMGGKLIARIMAEYANAKQVSTWVLQPMNEVAYLRQFLAQNGFKIETDVLILDDKFYHFLKVVAKPQKLTKLQQNFGINCLTDQSSDFLGWLNYKFNKISNLLSKIPENSEKHKVLSGCISDINNIKQKLKENKQC